MAKCPNTNLPEWKALEASRPDLAYYLWDKYKGNVPYYEYAVHQSKQIDKILKLKWLESRGSKTLFIELINNKLRGLKRQHLNLIRSGYLDRVQQLNLPLFDNESISLFSDYMNTIQSIKSNTSNLRLSKFLNGFGPLFIYSPNQFLSFEENNLNTIFIRFNGFQINIKCSEELSILLKDKPALCFYIDLFSISLNKHKEEIELSSSIIFHNKLTKRELEVCKILLLTHMEDEVITDNGDLQYPTLGNSYDLEQIYVEIDVDGEYKTSGDYIQDGRDQMLHAQNHDFYQNYRNPELESTDWSQYDDALDMDQQGQEFWGQF